MKLNASLLALRLERNLSQEKLAELVGVSRQAVTKWENGQAEPDLSHLVAMAQFFQVSVDALVHGRACRLPGEKLSAGSGDVDALVLEFLLRAKRATYAGHGAELVSCRPASHDLEYREGSLYYLDSYLGSHQFAGQEALWHNDIPLWSMNYCGRVLSADFNGDFLKAALAKATVQQPYRGPAFFHQGHYTYHCRVSGSFTWFQGHEEIFANDSLCYECTFHGGTLLA